LLSARNTNRAGKGGQDQQSRGEQGLRAERQATHCGKSSRFSRLPQQGKEPRGKGKGPEKQQFAAGGLQAGVGAAGQAAPVVEGPRWPWKARVIRGATRWQAWDRSGATQKTATITPTGYETSRPPHRGVAGALAVMGLWGPSWADSPGRLEGPQISAPPPSGRGPPAGTQSPPPARRGQLGWRGSVCGSVSKSRTPRTKGRASQRQARTCVPRSGQGPGVEGPWGSGSQWHKGLSFSQFPRFLLRRAGRCSSSSAIQSPGKSFPLFPHRAHIRERRPFFHRATQGAAVFPSQLSRSAHSRRQQPGAGSSFAVGVREGLMLGRGVLLTDPWGRGKPGEGGATRQSHHPIGHAC